MKKALFFIIIATILTSFVIYKKASKQAVSENTSTGPIETSVPIKMSVYKSKKIGYTFSYPESWYLSAYDESDPSVKEGVHTLTNYDTTKAESFSNHGIVDWDTFMNGKAAIKVEIIAGDIENQTKESLTASYLSGFQKADTSELTIGDFSTSQYDLKTSEISPFVESFTAFPYDKKYLFVIVTAFNIDNVTTFRHSEDWQLLKIFLRTFYFIPV